MPREQPAGCILLLAFLGLSGLVGAVTRTYHIGILEEYWNYVPQGKNVITDTSFSEDKLATLFLERGPNRIGNIYKKAVYRHFTDGTYSTEIPKPSWLGFLGPILRAEVGDVIVIHLKNFASRPYSLHPHGVFYNKDSEGALYPDGTSGRNKDDDMVPPGKNYTYVWPVREEYAPTSADANCLTWVYHSHIDAPKDICSGLIGPLLVCKEGILNRYSGTRTDVDREFVIMFTLVDENQSWYLDENIQHFCTKPSSVDKDDAVFQRSNKMHALNGYLFGNFPEPEMCVGESVSWHLFGMGNEIDIHSIYFYGNTFISRGHRTDTVNLFPATFLTTEMIVKNPGKWMITCQVSDHLQGPVIKAEVGDTLLVTFANKADKVYSILPHGVLYDKASDAGPNVDGFLKPGAHVKPGETFTYRWTVPESVSPTVDDPPCLTYVYFSAVDAIKDTSSGLVGPLLVCKKGVLNADGTQKGIDKEFYLLLTVFDENLSRYLDENIQKFTWRPFSVDKEDKEFVKSNRMHAINGYMYGNQPGLSMCKKDRVSWHLIGMGTDTDMHGVYFQGNTIHLRGTHRDSLTLFPHVSTTVFMQPDHAGPMIHAEVGDTILIIFKNKASRPYSISAQGIEDMDSGKRLDVPITKPGEVKTYRWNVPKRSGPGPSDPNCIPWVYYSTANFVKDTYSGLMGPLITCREGVLNEKGRRSDVDYEFALLFLVFNENESWYLDDNIKKYLNKDPRDVKHTDDFEESNKMHDNRIPYSTKSPGGASHPATVPSNGREELYFFGKNLGPRGAKATLVILFIVGLLLLVTTVILSLRLRSARRQRPYQEVQSCALPTDAL
ncbi:hypothetical protein GHT09_006339 [Marmota monax]|uniref:ferroxidase n=1 Tax=Marmota monax TaxID=9995 RepID=A0A834PRV3_MARMO|nr:hypothetical protein GHT09_006339 [Marmota monax]